MSKKKSKELVERAAEKLAEIFIKQIESKKGGEEMKDDF